MRILVPFWSHISFNMKKGCLATHKWYLQFIRLHKLNGSSIWPKNLPAVLEGPKKSNTSNPDADFSPNWKLSDVKFVKDFLQLKNCTFLHIHHYNLKRLSIQSKNLSPTLEDLKESNVVNPNADLSGVLELYHVELEKELFSNSKMTTSYFFVSTN